MARPTKAWRMALIKEANELSRKEKEFLIYKFFFLQSEEVIAAFQEDWGAIYKKLHTADWSFQLEQMPELYVDLVYQWCRTLGQ